MGIASRQSRPIDIIIPFCRNALLVGLLFESLHEVREELSELGCTIIAINDSADDPELAPVLTTAIDALSAFVPCRIMLNEPNVGFVGSVNAAARQAVASFHDVLLLNCDTIVFEGALREIAEVAWADPMIAFVSPRSNDATISTFPQQDELRQVEPKECFSIFRNLCKYLPRFHFVPTVAGFCMFIKLEIMKEFGFLDESYALSYDEEHDLIMRANRCGYRAALANHAYVYHFGKMSFRLHPAGSQSLQVEHAKIPEERYPEYEPSVKKYFAGVRHQAERIMAGMLPDSHGRLDLLFDLSTIEPTHNGTHDTCKQILLHAARSWHQFNLYVMAPTETVRFHRLDEIERLFFLSVDTQRTFAVALRFGQPFSYEPLFRLSRIAAANVYCMLDPISYDCLNLRNDDLEDIWGAVFEHSDGIIYISDFVKELFHRRFYLRPGIKERVTHLSLDYNDYADQATSGGPEGDYLLVIGNAHAHKRVAATVNALSQAFPTEKIVALGMSEDQRHNVIAYPSGKRTEQEMANLMRGARLVVFPSTYEGFGIPVVESLAYRKPLLARDIPTNSAIQEKLDEYDNLILYSSTDELVRRLRQAFPVWKERRGRHEPGPGWVSVTDEIGQFMLEISRTVCFDGVLVPRLQQMRLLEQRAKLQAQNGTAQKAMEALSAEANRTAAAAARSEQLTTLLRDRDEQIRDIYSSWSWRITAPVRRLFDIYQFLTRKK